MIKYDRLWKTMKEKGITQYDLYTTYNVNRSQINRLKHNKNVEINTIDKLCNILHCRVEDIMEHFEDNNIFYRNRILNFMDFCFLNLTNMSMVYCIQIIIKKGAILFPLTIIYKFLFIASFSSIIFT